jgi:hypothetical protein
MLNNLDIVSQKIITKSFEPDKIYRLQKAIYKTNKAKPQTKKIS